MAVKTYPANYNYGTGAAPYYKPGVEYRTPQPSDFMRGMNNLRKLTDTVEARAARTQANVEKQLTEFAKAHNLPSKAERDAADREAANKAPKGATIHADQPSECFVSLSWKNGVATAEFRNGVWDYEMSKAEFLDWALSDSLGEFFNDNIR
jgi:hypothetical protein